MNPERPPGASTPRRRFAFRWFLVLVAAADSKAISGRAVMKGGAVSWQEDCAPNHIDP
jgi:hypothetical protein